MLKLRGQTVAAELHRRIEFRQSGGDGHRRSRDAGFDNAGQGRFEIRDLHRFTGGESRGGVKVVAAELPFRGVARQPLKRTFTGPMKSVLSLVVLFFCPLLVWAQTRHTGEIAGAQFIVDVPAEPTGDVLFLARGYRPDSLPLSAIYEEETTFFQTLRATGWTIASTSFRGNRWVMADGGEDLVALYAHLDAEIVPVERAFLYGESMGGGIVAWMAEHTPQHFDGAIALGAYLYEEAKWETPENPTLAPYLPGKPGFPLVFLTNKEEMAGSVAYVARAQDSAYPPVLWPVDRPGHVNLNSAERLAALEAVVQWSEGDIPSSVEDASIRLAPTSVAARHEGRAAGAITRIRPLYGNIYTNLVAGDLTALEIELGDTFILAHGTQTVEPTFAKAYSDVPLGAWVAFIDPEGHVQISRNYANAAQSLGAEKGDALLLQAK